MPGPFDIDPDTGMVVIEYPSEADPTRMVAVPMRVTPETLDRVATEAPELVGSMRPLSMVEAQSLLSTQDLERRREVIRQNPTFARLATAGFHLSNSLFFGLPSLLLTTDDERRTIQALREEFPGTAFFSSLGGEALPALLTGGAGLARAGAGNLIPGVASAAAANTVERMIATRLMAREVSPRLARGLGLAAGASVDGGLSAMGAAVAQSGITGTPLDAEFILSNGLVGSVLGLGTGGLLGTTLGGGAQPRALQQIRHAAENGVGSRFVQQTPDGSFMVTAGDPPLAEGALADFLSSRIGRVLSGQASEENGVIMRQLLMPGAIQEVSNPTGYTNAAMAASDRMERALNSAMDEANQTVRSAQFRRAALADVPGDLDITPLLNTLMEDTTRLRDTIRGAERRVTPSDLGAAQRLARAMNGVQTARTPAALAWALDDVLEHSRVNRILSGISDVDLRAAAARLVGDGTTDNAGSVAAALSNMSDSGARVARIHRALRNVDNAERDLRGGAIRDNVTLDERRINPGVIFQSISDSGFRVKLNLMREFHTLNQKWHEVLQLMEDDWGISTASSRADIRSLSDELEDLRQRGILHAGYRSLQSQASQTRGLLASIGMSAPMVSGLVGGGIGTAVAGPVGGAIGVAAGLTFSAATHPLAAIASLGALSSARRAGQTTLTDGVGRLRTSLRQKQRRGLRAAQRVGVRALTNLSASLRSERSRREEYGTMVAQLRELAGNPSMLQAIVEEAVDRPGTVSEPLASTMAISLVRAVTYMANNLPAADQPHPFSHMMKLEPSQAEMESFIRRWEALENPLGILDLAAQHMLTREHVEAVATVYPALFAEVQNEVASMIGELQDLPSYASRIQVGTLLDITTDPSLDQRFIARMQSRYAQTNQQQQQGGQSVLAQNRLGASQVSTRRLSGIASNTYSESQSLEIRLGGLR